MSPTTLDVNATQRVMPFQPVTPTVQALPSRTEVSAPAPRSMWRRLLGLPAPPRVAVRPPAPEEPARTRASGTSPTAADADDDLSAAIESLAQRMRDLRNETLAERAANSLFHALSTSRELSREDAVGLYHAALKAFPQNTVIAHYALQMLSLYPIPIPATPGGELQGVEVGLSIRALTLCWQQLHAFAQVCRHLGALSQLYVNIGQKVASPQLDGIGWLVRGAVYHVGKLPDDTQVALTTVLRTANFIPPRVRNWGDVAALCGDYHRLIRPLPEAAIAWLKQETPDLVCALTIDATTEPVLTPWGSLFERIELTRALAHDPKCPLTRRPLYSGQLASAESMVEVLTAAARRVVPVAAETRTHAADPTVESGTQTDVTTPTEPAAAAAEQPVEPTVTRLAVQEPPYGAAAL